MTSSCDFDETPSGTYSICVYPNEWSDHHHIGRISVGHSDERNARVYL